MLNVSFDPETPKLASCFWKVHGVEGVQNMEILEKDSKVAVTVVPPIFFIKAKVRRSGESRE